MYKCVSVALAALIALSATPSIAQVVNATWYESGSRTATGAHFNPNYVHGVAHKTLPIGTFILATNIKNGKTLCVVVNDRGPYIRGRTLDFTRAGAQHLGFKNAGTAKIDMVVGGCRL